MSKENFAPSYSGMWLVSLMTATTSDATKMMWNIWNIYWNICSSWGHSFEVIQCTISYLKKLVSTHVNLYWMLSLAEGLPSTRSSNLCRELGWRMMRIIVMIRRRRMKGQRIWNLCRTNDFNAKQNIDKTEANCKAAMKSSNAMQSNLQGNINEEISNLAVISRPSFSQ